MKNINTTSQVFKEHAVELIEKQILSQKIAQKKVAKSKHKRYQKVITKCVNFITSQGSLFYYKLRQKFITKRVNFFIIKRAGLIAKQLLQYAYILLQNASNIKKRDSTPLLIYNYKVRKLF